jgi:hypothetical protein
MRFLKTVSQAVFEHTKQISLRDATIQLKDGSSNNITVKIGQGNLTYTERRELEYITDRGSLDTVRQGDDQPVEVRMDFQWDQLTDSSGGTATVEDALKQEGGAAGWTSSDTANACNPYAVDLEVTVAPGCTGMATNVITFPDFRWDQLDHDLPAGTVSCVGRSNATEATQALS